MIDSSIFFAYKQYKSLIRYTARQMSLDFFSKLVSMLRINRTISASAIRLYLFYKQSSDVYAISKLSADSLQGMWLFCALCLVTKVVYDGNSRELHKMMRYKNQQYKNSDLVWAHMELQYLKSINFALCDFIYRIEKSE